MPLLDGHMFVFFCKHNAAFARLLAQIIKLRAQFHDYLIKTIRLKNGSEFTSQSFNAQYIPAEINIEHSITHVHTQNHLA